MITKICPTCGCSLVRLGIADEQADRTTYKSTEYFFCCSGCREIFENNPAPFVKEFEDTHVCPTCLAEKPTAYTVAVNHDGEDIRFCRCPYCIDAFRKDPDFYLDRLAGKTDFAGLFDGVDTSCCQ